MTPSDTPMTDAVLKHTSGLFRAAAECNLAPFARTLERANTRRSEALCFLIRAITDLARTPEYSNTELAGDLAGIISMAKNIMAENKEDKN